MKRVIVLSALLAMGISLILTATAMSSQFPERTIRLEDAAQSPGSYALVSIKWYEPNENSDNGGVRGAWLGINVHSLPYIGIPGSKFYSLYLTTPSTGTIRVFNFNVDYNRNFSTKWIWLPNETALLTEEIEAKIIEELDDGFNGSDDYIVLIGYD